VFASMVRTDSNGAATLIIKNAGPGVPRRFIDGQVYGIGYDFADARKDQIATGTGLEPDNFISLLLFARSIAPAEPTWNDVRPILQQHANLRPHGPRNYVGQDFTASLI
jgi:hypothetical protein